MNRSKKFCIAIVIITCLSFIALPQAMAAGLTSFDVNKMGDMSDFDPNNPIIPTGDTIKIALMASFSGPAAVVGQIYFISVQWAAHDINKRGGIMVDGKMKMVEVIKANTESKTAIAKKVAERMILQEKVDVLWGTNGSHIMKVINQVAKKYKKIAQCAASLSDDLYDAKNFTRYSFMSSFQTNQIGRAAAYYYGKRQKEKKFYILCQDYLFGHAMANGFKQGLKEYYPDAELVGEDYHKLFLTDFAPFLTKIKASGAEVIYTGDWIPDAANLLKQARQMGIMLPFANTFLDEPNMLHEVGIEGTKGLLNISQYGVENPLFKTPEQIKYYKTWNNLWKTKWQAPYNTRLYEHGTGNIGSYTQQTYWLLSVIERAGSTDPEKIIKTWEGDSYRMVNGKVITMRAQDHKAIQNLHAVEFVPPEEQRQSFNIEPYYFYKGTSSVGPVFTIPADKIMPLLDPDLKRTK
ncbi:ABC transporter, substrate-binding protein (cluster 4, leucine/isoleucine/valine/benzoate) [Olavius sp. associated proteobacterium Delta 1]|nr:ABC transporter, substrate-binding protein (cluster 4, leucine/isoleucine/valine/benzoate) [Olavius sp. associated proteobacterium Delta 1]